MQDGLAPQKALCHRCPKQMVFLKPCTGVDLSYSGLSPANDTGAKKKKKKQKKKKEKVNETDSAQDQPVKVTRSSVFLLLRVDFSDEKELGQMCKNGLGGQSPLVFVQDGGRGSLCHPRHR